jgi:hypothetical protein
MVICKCLLNISPDIYNMQLVAHISKKTNDTKLVSHINILVDIFRPTL